MTVVLIIAGGIIGGVALLFAFLIVSIAWTHYPQGIIRAWIQKRRQNRKQ